MSDYRVDLLSPSGKPFVSRSPMDTNDLIYGRGYRLAGGDDMPEEPAPQDSVESP